MKQSDLNHLRRLLGWIRCDIGQSPGEIQQTMIDVADGLGHPEISPEAKARMVEAYHRAESIPLYVRAAVKALEKALANGGPHSGVDATCATDETHYVDRGAARGSGLPLSDFAMEQGLAEVGITAWGPRAEDWVAGAEYAVRLMRECLPKAAAEALPGHSDAAGNRIANRDAPSAPPALRRDDAGGAGASRHKSASAETYLVIAKLAANLSNRDWRWWDSCSFRRLTFEDGQDRRDGSALHGTVQASDGHPDVNMAAGVREFIEAASPFAVGKLCNALAEKEHDLQGMRAVLTDLINECERADVQAAGEVQRLFIHPHVVELARRALGGHTEASSC